MVLEKDYTVYFEMFGKKMKIPVMAENEQKAKEKVLSKIVFKKVVKAETDFNSVIDTFDSLFKK